jgi:hypothetical protein
MMFFEGRVRFDDIFKKFEIISVDFVYMFGERKIRIAVE